LESKVTLKKSFEFIGLDQSKKIVPSGNYYISGFWGDACGLCNTIQEARDQDNKIIVPSKSLIYFDGVEE